MIRPRYPIYIPSRGRAETCYTAVCLDRDRVPFRLVIERPEREKYAARFGAERLLLLPFTGRGLIGSRNWIKRHAMKEGHKRHWQLDDNIRRFLRAYKGKRYRCDAGVALRVTEDLADRYENVAIAGMNYSMFWVGATRRAPFYVNQHVYSCTLVLNQIRYKWRTALNDDTDICLQVLAGGWCTILMNAFLCEKMQTMMVKGGNTSIYKDQDGRLKMARSLERLWPGVVETKRRFKRPQHVIKYAWRHFDTPLKLARGIDLRKIKPNEYGLELRDSKHVLKVD